MRKIIKNAIVYNFSTVKIAIRLNDLDKRYKLSNLDFNFDFI